MQKTFAGLMLALVCAGLALAVPAVTSPPTEVAILALPRDALPAGDFVLNAGVVAAPPLASTVSGAQTSATTKALAASGASVAGTGAFDARTATVAGLVASGSTSGGRVRAKSGSTSGTFVFYTLGDSDMYQAALNAIAMLFSLSSNAGLVGSKDGSTVDLLGPIAAIGMLLSLMFVCVSGIMKQEIRLDTLLVTFILSWAMFVPKTTVIIEDLYSGSVKTVANVPVGVAVPGALISMFTKNFAEKIETAFSTPNSGFQPLLTDNGNGGPGVGGFANPLKMLLALQKINMCDSNSDICADMLEYTRSCQSDNQGNRISPEQVFKSPDVLTALFGAAGAGKGIQASTVYRSAFHLTPVGILTTPALLAAGGIVSCDDAAAAIRVDIETYIDNPAGVNGGVNSFKSDFAHAMGQRKLGAMTTGTIPGVNDTGGTAWSDELDASLDPAALLGQGAVANVSIDRRGVIGALLMRNPTFAAFAASNQADRGAAYEMFMTVAMEQFKADAAGDGSMFLKTMLPSMTILTFFFFAFAPIVAMLVMITGLHSIKIIISYLTFGLWTQSWLPGAAIVNYFIQQQWLSKVSGTGSGVPGGMFSIANQPEMYDLVSTQLAVGANMLASVPVVMMALMAGSAYGLSKLSESVGAGKGRLDSKGIAPDAMTAANAAALMENDTKMGHAYGRGETNNRFLAGEQANTPNFAYSGGFGEGTALGTSLSTGAKTAASNSTSKMHQAMAQSGKQWQTGESLKDTDTNTLSHGLSAKIDEAQGTGTSAKFGKQIADSTSLAIGAGARAMANNLGLSAAKAAMGASLLGSLEAMGIKGESAHKITSSMDAAMDSSLKNNFTTGGSVDQQKANQVAKSLEASVAQSFGESSSVSKAFGEQQTATTEAGKMSQASESAQKSQQGGASIQANGAMMVGNLETGSRTAQERANRMAPGAEAFKAKTDPLQSVMSDQAKKGVAAIGKYASMGSIRGVLGEANEMMMSGDATTAAIGHWAVGTFGGTVNNQGMQIGPSGLPKAAMNTGDHLAKMDGSRRAIEAATGAKLGGGPGVGGSSMGEGMDALKSDGALQSGAIDKAVAGGKGATQGALGAARANFGAKSASHLAAGQAAQADVKGKGASARSEKDATIVANSDQGKGIAGGAMGAFDGLATGVTSAAAFYSQMHEKVSGQVAAQEAKTGGKGGAAEGGPKGGAPEAAGGARAVESTAAPAIENTGAAAAPEVAKVGGGSAAPAGGAPTTAASTAASAGGGAANAGSPAAPAGAPTGSAAAGPSTGGAASAASEAAIAEVGGAAHPAAGGSAAAGEAGGAAGATAGEGAGAPKAAGAAAAASSSPYSFKGVIESVGKSSKTWWALGAADTAYEGYQQGKHLTNRSDQLQLGAEKAGLFTASMVAGGHAGVIAAGVTAPSGPGALVAGAVTAIAVGGATYYSLKKTEEALLHHFDMKTGEEKANENMVKTGIFPHDNNASAQSLIDVQKVQEKQRSPAGVPN